MRVAVTGTPGTGKTTAVERLETDLEVVHLNAYIREAGLDEGTDPQRGSLVADLEAVSDRLESRADLLVESHLAHHLEADRVAVLRCHPEQIRARLLERGESEATAEENAEAEALDVVLSEAVEAHGLDSVYEIDTTDCGPDAVAGALAAVLSGERAPAAGEVSFLEYL
jgi:adenylate kinase